jgi:hypothetical protein
VIAIDIALIAKHRRRAGNEIFRTLEIIESAALLSCRPRSGNGTAWDRLSFRRPFFGWLFSGFPKITRKHLGHLARRLSLGLIVWLLLLLRFLWRLRRLMPADYRLASRLKLPWLLRLLRLLRLFRLFGLGGLFGIISWRSILPVDYRITSRLKRRLKLRTTLILSALVLSLLVNIGILRCRHLSAAH